MRRVLGVVAAAVLLASCGEPAADVRIPDRGEGQVVLDQADILEDESVVETLTALGGRDVVALTFLSPQAGMGEADRAGRQLLAQWDADIALVAVAPEGDFASADVENRERYFGLVAADAYDVPRGLREEIVEQLAPAIAADNEWTRLFVTAAQQLREALG